MHHSPLCFCRFEQTQVCDAGSRRCAQPAGNEIPFTTRGLEKEAYGCKIEASGSWLCSCPYIFESWLLRVMHSWDVGAELPQGRHFPCLHQQSVKQIGAGDTSTVSLALGQQSRRQGPPFLLPAASLLSASGPKEALAQPVSCLSWF